MVNYVQRFANRRLILIFIFNLLFHLGFCQGTSIDALSLKIDQTEFPGKTNELMIYFGLKEENVKIGTQFEKEKSWLKKGVNWYQQYPPTNLEELEGLYFCQLNLARLYIISNEFDEAVTLYMKILKGIDSEGKKSGRLSIIRGKALMGMNIIYSNQGKPEKAIEMIQKAITSFEHVADTFNLARCYNGLGLNYNQIGDFNQAEWNLKKSIGLLEKISAYQGLIEVKGTLAYISSANSRWQDAAKLYEEILPEMRKRKDEFFLYTIGNLARAYAELGRGTDAWLLINEGAEVANQTKRLDAKATYYKNCSLVAEQTGDFKEALKWSNLEKQYIDSLDSKLIEAAGVEAKVSIDQKIRDLETHIQEEQRLYKIKVILALLVGLLSLGVLSWLIYQKKQKENKHLLKQLQVLLEQSNVVDATDKTKIELVWKGTDAPIESQTDQNLIFLQLFTRKVQSRIYDPTFSVDSLAASMHISRVHLFKKVKTATGGASPSELIRAIKLETAKKLLTEEKKSVTEVSDMLCFSSPNNFSRAFKEYFNQNPSDLLGNNLPVNA